MESLSNSYFCPKWAFCEFWAARPVLKTKLVMNYELLLRAVFSCFSWAKIDFCSTPLPRFGQILKLLSY